MRLNKFIATATGVSRRAADEMIAQNRVEIELGQKKSPARIGQQIDEKSHVFLDNHEIMLPKTRALVMLNKPRGYVSSRAAQTKFARTLYELLPENLARLKTVGRLDKDSSGLILLTDDGDLAQNLTHPRYKKHKSYLVRLDKPLAPLHQQMITDFGVELADGKSQLGLTQISERVELSENDFLALKSARKIDFSAREIWRVEMSEGRNRQIRRTFAALGYEVERLHRTDFGEYSLGDLGLGEFRKIE